MDNLPTNTPQDLRRGIMVLVNTVNTLVSSREISIVRTNLQEAMMFTGNLMKYSRLGDNPYAKKDGKRKEVEDIQPLFDATSTTLELEGKNEIEKIDTLREVIDKFFENFANYSAEHNIDFEDSTNVEDLGIMTCILNISTSLMKSRMWLGMALGAIRDVEKGKIY